MNKPAEQQVVRQIDRFQQQIADYAGAIRFESLSPEAVQAAKVRILDTFGSLMGGFFDESSRIARQSAARSPSPGGSTVIGTRMVTTPDTAAFVNATTPRCVEMNDTLRPSI